MIRIGISGWRYPPWRGAFYPQGLPQRRELEYAAARLATIELNGSFYSLQRPSSYQQWAAQTPEGFVFSIKGSRFVTHMLRLRGVETALANFFASGVLALGPKLGPVLWQLPARHVYDPDELAAFFNALPRTTRLAAVLAEQHDDRLKEPAWTQVDADVSLRHVLEVRHPSFETAECLNLLRRHDIGIVIADTAGRWPQIDAVTTDVVYVRLHGDQELYASGYSDEALGQWAERVRRWSAYGDVYVYFDNDVKVHAPHDARALADKLGVGPVSGDVP